MIDNYVLPKQLKHKALEQIISLDVGCSVGTMAIEMASRGFRSYGVDFDPISIEIANKLAKEENLNIDFQVSDVSEWNLGQKIDIALCFDIFEHLHDDEIGALLNSVKSKLNFNGALIFHTFPQEYEYIFHTKLLLSLIHI